MVKIVYNNCYGGFSLSKEGKQRYKELSGKDLGTGSGRKISRNDPHLVQVVEELGSKANGGFSELVMKDLPKGTRYRIDEYDGIEKVTIKSDDKWNVA